VTKNQKNDSSPPVIVIRQRRGPDVIGILAGGKTKEDGISSYISTYVIEHPFVPIQNYNNGTFNLIPFCPLTEQTLFDFHTKDMVFMHPAKDDLAMEYLSGLARMNTISVTDDEEVREQKRAFRKALRTLQISPSTETIQ